MKAQQSPPADVLTVVTMDDWAGAAHKLLDHAGEVRKFALYGEIGAGKTTLVQAFGKLLGLSDQLTSPTFALVNEYQAPEFLVHHIDLYRLEDMEEALQIGIEDYLYDDSYCFVEWPELIEELLPEQIVRIKITLEPDSSRKILVL